MTTLPPPDDNFDDMARQLEDVVVPDEEEIIDFTKLDNTQLVNTWHLINDQLRTLREEMVPRSDRGRELHSLRAASRVELAKRGLL